MLPYDGVQEANKCSPRLEYGLNFLRGPSEHMINNISVHATKIALINKPARLSIIMK